MQGLGPNPEQIKSPTVASSVTQYRAVVLTNTDSQVDMPGGANAQKFAGVALEDQSTTGDPVPVATDGIVPIEVSESVNAGEFARISGTSGKAETSNPSSGSNDYVIGQFMANADADGDVVPLDIRKSVHQG